MAELITLLVILFLAYIIGKGMNNDWYVYHDFLRMEDYHEMDTPVAKRGSTHCIYVNASVFEDTLPTSVTYYSWFEPLRPWIWLERERNTERTRDHRMSLWYSIFHGGAR